MKTVKSLAIITLVVGGTSLAMAQNDPVRTGQTGPKQPQAASPYMNPYMMNPYMQSAPYRSNMYMAATRSHRKAVRTGQTGPKQPQ